MVDGKAQNKYANHYCPVCLWPVNERTGDHWNYCEYEPHEGCMPLTELEMLERKLTDAKDWVKHYRAKAREYTMNIKNIENRIGAIKEKLMKKSTETVDCNGTQVEAWFIENDVRWTFDRPAVKDSRGGLSLAQLRDDECMRAPGAIYRRAPHI